jgi:hypothetical protein
MRAGRFRPLGRPVPKSVSFNQAERIATWRLRSNLTRDVAS